MKKQGFISLLTAIALTFTGCNGGKSGMLILGILGILVLLFAIMRTYSSVQYARSRQRKKHRKKESAEQILLTVILYALAVVLLLGAALCIKNAGSAPGSETTPATTLPQASTDPNQPQTPSVSFHPEKVSSTDPGNWGITWEIYEGSNKVTSYNRSEPISFGAPDEYFSLPGIATFRGNNYRNNPSYGTANVTANTLTKKWEVATTAIAGGRWAGCGWTGQPLMAQWDAQTKAIMNMKPEKQNDPDLVEVIYATLDGHIYFIDLKDGTPTRDPIVVGMCFKGAGALDPRGYPLMYVGAGDKNVEGKRPRMFIISLIDGSILYEYGHEEALSLRTDNGNWCAFDSSPLVHAATDTLIWPGESGVLYTMKLNTAYDKAAGTISINPGNMVRTRYNTARSNGSTYWLGYEASINVIGNYMYVSENGGMFFCIDLNTMALVWAQDTKDDSNSTPVFEYISETEAYIYTAPSLHWTKDANNQGSISIYKLNALTGEIVWQKPYNVHTVSGVSGGIQSSPLLGKPGTTLAGKIIYTIARTPEVGSGIMVALDTKTGNEVWRMDMHNYAWSSPAPVYTPDGKGYIIVCDSMGYMFLVDSSGNQKTILNLGTLVEASPAIFNNRIVVGLKAGPIVCVEIA